MHAVTMRPKSKRFLYLNKYPPSARFEKNHCLYLLLIDLK